jgi:hypothetical protein
MKTIPVNLELIPEVVSKPPSVVTTAARFQVIVEYAAGVYFPSAVAQSPEEAVEAFMVQMPACEEGEISLIDRDEQQVVASVKWTVGETEIGLRVPHRLNVFHDWHLALIAVEVQKRRLIQAAVELSD